MILLWWSTCRSGWAASMPSSASTTTSFGSLISFFMRSLSGLGLRAGSGAACDWRDGRVSGSGSARSTPGPAVWRSAGVRDEQAVEQRGGDAGEQLGAEVDRAAGPTSRSPPAICWTSIGPNVRAGLIEAPVAGATGMIAAKTTRPIATPAKPAAALRWMTPKMVKTRMNVPTNSAVNACVQLMSP